MMSPNLDDGPSAAEIKNFLNIQKKNDLLNATAMTTEVDDVAEPEVAKPVYTERKWCKMDSLFPINTDEGRMRVEYFRRIKYLLKFIAGERRSYHNFVTGGASPDEIIVKRRIDRIYHKDLLVVDGEYYVVFSVSGDAFLRGQIRKVIGAVLCVIRGWISLAYFERLFSEEVLDVPMVIVILILIIPSQLQSLTPFFLLLPPFSVPSSVLCIRARYLGGRSTCLRASTRSGRQST